MLHFSENSPGQIDSIGVDSVLLFVIISGTCGCLPEFEICSLLLRGDSAIWVSNECPANIVKGLLNSLQDFSQSNLSSCHHLYSGNPPKIYHLALKFPSLIWLYLAEIKLLLADEELH